MRNYLIRFLSLAVAASLALAGCGGSSTPAAPGLNAPSGITTSPIDDGNAATAPAVFAIPAAINSGNQLVGSAEAVAGAVLQPAFWMVDDAGAATVAATAMQPLFADGFAAALDLNSDGVIVGTAANTDTSIRAVVWADALSAPQLLQSLAPGGFASAYAINDSGRIVGAAENADGLWQAVRWQRSVADGSLTGPFLLPGTPAGWEAEANAVNADDTIVGELIDTDGVSHAVIWQFDVGSGSYVRLDLPTPGAFVHASALDLAPASGTLLVVVGEAADDGLGGMTQAYQWSIDSSTVPATIGSVALGAADRSSSAVAINTAGRSAGWQQSAAALNQAVVWDGSAPASILMFSESQAYDINDLNLVVGRNGTSGFVKLAN